MMTKLFKTNQDDIDDTIRHTCNSNNSDDDEDSTNNGVDDVNVDDDDMLE